MGIGMVAGGERSTTGTTEEFWKMFQNSSALGPCQPKGWVFRDVEKMKDFAGVRRYS